MSKATVWTCRAIFVALAALLIANPAYADNKYRRDDRDDRKKHSDRRDDRRGDRNEHSDRRDDRRGDQDQRSRSRHFDDHRRVVVHEYYVKQYRGRRCPPGFYRRARECGPSQRARRWERGHRLPRDVIFHTVPPQLVVELGVPPAGHRYVRVASDILMIAIGTGLVVDAINDLGRQ